jgi:transaldolase/glucose-6-phosphate isomerase
MNVINRPTQGLGEMATGNPLKQMEAYGQSPWLDFIQRSFIGPKLQELLDRDGLKGITSNPAIFEKAMGHGTDYDEGFKTLADKGDMDALDVYEALAVQDIQAACDMLLPVYHATHKIDGYVSIEVSPYLALRTDDTIAEARRLWKWVDRPNLMVKVPGTDAGVPAIRTLIADGMNINVTLLFALSAYQAVAEAFIAGLEERHGKGESVADIASVASFFVSRIDVAIDKKIDERVAAGETELKKLRGKVAIANAKIAYQHYLDLVGSPRWQALAKDGDVLYVDELIGRDTVNTIPPATMDAFRDHGSLRESLIEDVEGAKTVLAEAEKAGLDLAGVTKALVVDGVKLFADAADNLLGAVATKRATMLGGKVVSMTAKLPEALQKSVDTAAKEWAASGKLRDLWAGEASVWTGGDEGHWLGWLKVVDAVTAELPKLKAFQDKVKAGGFTDILLLGMGGSSLGPEVLAETFGKQSGFPTLHILDSTDPAQIKALQAKLDLTKTLCIVSSKSGSTLEPNIFKAYFWDETTKAVGGWAGKHFVAVTDPGSKMQKVAEDDRFGDIFFGDKTIGGRYSVLSNFGMVPAAAMGLDLDAFTQATSLMVRSCASGTPPAANPGAKLGFILGEAAKAGRDKVTIFATPGLSDVGAWLEQLLAESTGKIGKGIVPVDGEPIGAPGVYGADRVFAYLKLAGESGPDAEIEALAAAGHPVVTIEVGTPMQVGQMFFLWEFATAVAGSLIGIDPFDQPDVEASKIETKKLMDAYSASGSLPAESPFAEGDGMKLFADAAGAKALGSDVAGAIKAQFGRVGPGDYVALLAYVDRTPAAIEALTSLRKMIRDKKHVATCVGFGPRFLHSTGQVYKGGPNSGVVLQITAEHPDDLAVPGETYSFGTVIAAQARGDFDVLAERGRRAVRVHLGADVAAGLKALTEMIAKAL